MKATLAPSFKIHQIRYIIIPVLALVLVHLVTYGKLPYDPEYQFPVIPFIVITAVGLFVCETNRFNYNRLALSCPLNEAPLINALKRLGSNLIVCTIVFVALTTISNLVITGHIPHLTRYLNFILIVWLIVIAETAVFVAYDLYQQGQKPQTNGLWSVPSGTTIMQVKPQEVAYMNSKQGLVLFILHSGDKIITNFNSFEEVQQKLNLSQFFRLNRQYYVHSSSVLKVKAQVNRKLEVELSPTLTEDPHLVVVSRYKSADFKKWLQAQSHHSA